MLGAAEVVRDVVMVDPTLAWRGATLDILRVSLAGTASDIGADRAPCDSAADGCDVLPASAAHLVAENASEHRPDDGTRDIGAAPILRDLLLMLDPAALLGGSEHLAHRHFAVGHGFPFIGGTNVSAVHWDMVKDLRRGGRIELDGELVQENGEWAF